MTLKQSFLREQPKNINEFFNVNEQKKKQQPNSFFTEFMRKKTVHA